MPHLHIGIAQGLVIYLWWLVFHILVQQLAIWLHNTRIGQALGIYG